MGSVVSKIADEIKLHGSYEAYVKFRDTPVKTCQPLPDQGKIPYFPDPEVVPNTAGFITKMYDDIRRMLNIQIPRKRPG